MKLGIVVVYLFGAQNERLLDLHVRQIEKHTQVPYNIYGSVNRLLPQYRQKLEEHSQIQVCECPGTDLRGGEEHAYYLDHLVEMAILDGASHVVSLHLDSFPVRSGWARELAGRLSPTRVLATLDRISTACLFFHREFFLQHRPTFRLPVDDLASSKYRQYVREWDPLQHSGVGYGFKAYSEGLSWYYLTLSTEGTDASSFGRVYDDLIFHLRGATFLGERPVPALGILEEPRYGSFIDRAYRMTNAIIPVRAKEFLRTELRTPIEQLVHRPRAGAQRPQLEQAREELIEDPDAYLDQLRGSKGHTDTPPEN
jgi:hypothetical protein